MIFIFQNDIIIYYKIIWIILSINALKFNFIHKKRISKSGNTFTESKMLRSIIFTEAIFKPPADSIFRIDSLGDSYIFDTQYVTMAHKILHIFLYDTNEFSAVY